MVQEQTIKAIRHLHPHDANYSQCPTVCSCLAHPFHPPAQPPESSVCGFSALHHLEVSHVWGHTWHCLLPPSTWEYAVLGFYGSRENWQGDKAKPCRCCMQVSGKWQFLWDAGISLISIISVFALWCLSVHGKCCNAPGITSAPLNSTDLMISLEKKLGIAWIRL